MPANTGARMKMYRNSGTVAVPTWSLVSEVGDVSIADLEMGLAELKRRANAFTKNLPTLIQSISVEFRLHHGLDAVTYTALRTAFFNGTISEWALMDGPIDTDGSEGIRCPFLINQFPWDQALEEVTGHDVRLAAGYMVESDVEVDPSWYVISS